jgi:3-hydroxyacyl-[acyl-carrier-protein] dehydratase
VDRGKTGSAAAPQRRLWRGGQVFVLQGASGFAKFRHFLSRAARSAGQKGFAETVFGLYNGGPKEPMKFYLVDRILELEPPKRIVAAKSLSLAEEYLADHFPSYPVLPGVMMLEAVVQAAAWLVRVSTDFDKTLILLREAQNVRYGNFVRPGGQLIMTVEALEIGPTMSKFKAVGTCDGLQSVQAKLVLEQMNVADEDPSRADLDPDLRKFWRERFRLIGGPQILESAKRS